MLTAADECFLFRLLVKEIATRHGKLATFLGRPFADRGGSGLHLNISFRREDGSNAFHDPAVEDGLAPLAKECIAGLLSHHEAIAAFAAPHVNAYKRLQPDMLNGYWANWGYDDRTVCLRVPPARGEGTRIEHRMADGAANPYLVAAAVLHAARFGVEHQMQAPDAQPIGEPPNTDRGSRQRSRPGSPRSMPTTSSRRRWARADRDVHRSSSTPSGIGTPRPSRTRTRST